MQKLVVSDHSDTFTLEDIGGETDYQVYIATTSTMNDSVPPTSEVYLLCTYKDTYFWKYSYSTAITTKGGHFGSMWKAVEYMNNQGYYDIYRMTEDEFRRKLVGEG